MLVFGSPKANAILKKDRDLDWEVTEAERLAEEPVQRWLVTIEILREEHRYIMARTPEDAIDICERKHGGRAVSARPAKEA